MSKERSHAGEAYDIAAATSDRRGEPAHAGPTIDWGIPLPPSKAAPDSLLAGLKSGAWLDAQTFPELRYTVPLIIPEGTTVLAGAPKVGKSWMVFHIGLSVAAGHHVLGCLPTGRPRPVLYLALEDGWRRLQSRARSLLGMGKQIPAALDVLIEVQHGLVAATILEWLEVHGDEAPLVIVDTLGRVMPRSNAGESAYERDYRAVTTYKQVTDRYPGSSMVLVHHTRKLGSEDFVDGVSGTLGITGAADTTVVLSRSRSDDGGLLKVTGRDITEAEYAVEKADNGFWKLHRGSPEGRQYRAGHRRCERPQRRHHPARRRVRWHRADRDRPEARHRDEGRRHLPVPTRNCWPDQEGEARRVPQRGSPNPHTPHTPHTYLDRRRGRFR